MMEGRSWQTTGLVLWRVMNSLRVGLGLGLEQLVVVKVLLLLLAFELKVPGKLIDGEKLRDGVRIPLVGDGAFE